MLKSIVLSSFTLIAASAALAQDSDHFTLGGDHYSAGRNVAVTAPVAGDLFAAAEKVDISADVAGNAHAMGRILDLGAGVGGDVYLAGYEITLEAPVTGAASLFAAEVTVKDAVGGNLRASASDLTLTADVGGAALLAAGSVDLNGVIAGDAVITAEKITFGPGARVDGRLTLYTPDAGALQVPASVVSESRLTLRSTEEFEEFEPPVSMEEVTDRGMGAAIRSFLGGVVVVAILAALAVAVAPGKVAAIRARALDRPGRAILGGFVAMSALIGAVLVLAFTLVGLLLVPVAIALAGLLVAAGYVLGSYILGVGLWQAAGRQVPETVPEKAGLAALGALLAGLVALLPVLGWLSWFALVFLGLGAMMLPLFTRLSAMGESS